MSPCNFATTLFPAERSSFISMQLRNHPLQSLHSLWLRDPRNGGPFCNTPKIKAHQALGPPLNVSPRPAWSFSSLPIGPMTSRILLVIAPSLPLSLSLSLSIPVSSFENTFFHRDLFANSLLPENFGPRYPSRTTKSQVLIEFAATCC